MIHKNGKPGKNWPEVEKVRFTPQRLFKTKETRKGEKADYTFLNGNRMDV